MQLPRCWNNIYHSSLSAPALLISGSPALWNLPGVWWLSFTGQWVSEFLCRREGEGRGRLKEGVREPVLKPSPYSKHAVVFTV